MRCWKECIRIEKSAFVELYTCSTFFSTLDIIASPAILKDIDIPDDVLPQLERALRLDSGRAKEHRKSEGERRQIDWPGAPPRGGSLPRQTARENL